MRVNIFCETRSERSVKVYRVEKCTPCPSRRDRNLKSPYLVSVSAESRKSLHVRNGSMCVSVPFHAIAIANRIKNNYHNKEINR
jgi:hypothetical protein